MNQSCSSTLNSALTLDAVMWPRRVSTSTGSSVSMSTSTHWNVSLDTSCSLQRTGRPVHRESPATRWWLIIWTTFRHQRGKNTDDDNLDILDYNVGSWIGCAGYINQYFWICCSVGKHAIACCEAAKPQYVSLDSKNTAAGIIGYKTLLSVPSVLLSFVSGEDVQDRTDRIMLTPWLKFLWEAYRNVLELLRNNIRVEKLYHETAQQGT